MKGSDKLQEGGKYWRNKTQKKAVLFFFFNDVYIIFTGSDIMGIFSHFLNYVFLYYSYSSAALPL